MDPATLAENAAKLATEAASLAQRTKELANQVTLLTQRAAEAGGHGPDPFVIALTVFALACFVGYYVVWRVTPALHSPLMAVTNAISSVIIVGAILAMGGSGRWFTELWGFFGVVLASVNIFGGFVVTQRMLGKFKKKQK